MSYSGNSGTPGRLSRRLLLAVALLVLGWLVYWLRSPRAAMPGASGAPPPCPLLSATLHGTGLSRGSRVLGIVFEGRLEPVKGVGRITGQGWIPHTATVVAATESGVQLVAVPASGPPHVALLPGTVAACRRSSDWGYEMDALSISPGGRYAALANEGRLYIIDLKSPLAIPRQINTIPPGGSYPCAREPVWSPDGRQVLVQDTAGGELVLFEVATGTRRPLASTRGNPIAASWSSDPTRLASLWSKPPDFVPGGKVQRVHLPPAQVRLLDLERQETKTIATAPQMSMYVAWRPGHEEVAYGDAMRLYRMRTDGTALGGVGSHTGRFNQFEPSWSADGEWLAYVLVRTRGRAIVLHRMSDGKEWPVDCGRYEPGNLSWQEPGGSPAPVRGGKSAGLP
jgi:hypothetical protein